MKIEKLIEEVLKNMRKIIVSLMLILSMPSVWAKIPVTVVWPFGAGSTLTHYTRAVINKANQDQSQYLFLLEIKPGAGGAIGAAYVAGMVDNGRLSVLSTTDAFFIRPQLVSNSGNYKIEDFQLMLPQVSTPMSLVGKPGVPLESVLKKNRSSIGTVGMGTGTHVMAEHIRLRATDMIIVPFKDPPESVQQVIGGNLDLAWENLPLALDNPRLQIYGITGKTHVPGVQNLSDLGFSSLANLDIASFIVAPKTMPAKQFTDIQSILIQAQKNNKYLVDSMRANWGVSLNINLPQHAQWYDARHRFFQDITRHMPKVE